MAQWFAAYEKGATIGESSVLVQPAQAKSPAREGAIWRACCARASRACVALERGAEAWSQSRDHTDIHCVALGDLHRARGASFPRSHCWCRPDALSPAGFSFALARLRQLLILPFKLWLFGCGRTDESGGPPLFEPSLQVEGDIRHIKTSGLCPRFIGRSTLGVI